eukprot:COSAG01_NODE_9946_length_2295_cov_1.247723_4_plen_87_part_00
MCKGCTIMVDAAELLNGAGVCRACAMGVGRSVELDKHVGTMVISPHSIQSQFDQLWGVIEQYRAAHPPHPPSEAEGRSHRRSSTSL